MAKVKVSKMRCPFCGAWLDISDESMMHCPNKACRTRGLEAFPYFWFKLFSYYNAWETANEGFIKVIAWIKNGHPDEADSVAKEYLRKGLEFAERDCSQGFDLEA